MQPRIESFREISLFAGLSKLEIGEILHKTQNRWYERGEKIFHEGDRSTSLFLLDKGSVDVVKIFDDKPQLITTLKATTIFGEMALTTEEPRSATVITREPSHIHELLENDFNDMLENHGTAACKMSMNISRILSNRMNHLLRESCKLGSTENKDDIGKTDLDTFRQKIFSEWSF